MYINQFESDLPTQMSKYAPSQEDVSPQSHCIFITVTVHKPCAALNYARACYLPLAACGPATSIVVASAIIIVILVSAVLELKNARVTFGLERWCERAQCGVSRWRNQCELQIQHLQPCGKPPVFLLYTTLTHNSSIILITSEKCLDEITLNRCSDVVESKAIIYSVILLFSSFSSE